jgi:tyrosyl-DNA phosphodiesterase-1
MLVCYADRLRVCIHTANYIPVDWHLKTQGVWMQDFPLKADNGDAAGPASEFENDLVAYLEATGWRGGAVPGCGHVSAAAVRRYDCSAARVALVASVPGTHKGASLPRWGHTRVRALLAAETFDAAFRNAPLAYQFSSQGSVTDNWQNKFRESLSAGRCAAGPLGIGQERIVWPTAEEMRTSFEGWAGGGSMPGSKQNVERDCVHGRHARWAPPPGAPAGEGRARAMPHIKTFVRHAGPRLAWLILGSHNFSKAAWGELQLGDSQLKIMSYELGVLFTGARAAPGAAMVATAAGAPPGLRGATLALPVPYALPPAPYGSQDQPWNWEEDRRQPDVHGRTTADYQRG